MPLDYEQLADVVVLTVKNAMAPVLERLSASEQANKELRERVVELTGLRDRLTVVETKHAAPNPPDAAFYELRDRLAAAELRMELKSAEAAPLTATLSELARDLGALRERLAVVEVRPSIPGPQGEPGPAGKDGENGTAGLSFEGVYQEGKSYDFGHLVTWGGSSWHCNEPTTTKPGEGSKAWTLMVKRGRDGKDGRDAVTVPVVSVGARG